MKAVVSLMFSLCFIGLMAGCQMTQSVENDTEKINILNPDNQPNKTDPELREKLEYVRYTADEMNHHTNDNRQSNVNRELLADMITKTILRSGHFSEVASLVTDREVVIVYKQHPHSEIDQTLAADLAADIARNTAMSNMPNFYQIYTTDNPLHFTSIEGANNTQDIESIINEINAKK